MNDNFDGFREATFKFLRQLKKNNQREWFQTNKQRYESEVLDPSLQFIKSLQSGLKKVTPFFQAIPKRTGGSLMRIYRDTRFSKDKTPYKTNIGIHIRHELGKDMHAPGFYFHLEPSESFFGAGIWHPDTKSLKKIRGQIAEQGTRWKRIKGNKVIKSNYRFEGESLKRPPRDFDSDHPLIEDIKRKDFIVLRSIKKNELISNQISKKIFSFMRDSRPLMMFLCESLQLPF